MDCPRCLTSLISHTVEDFQVDECPSCGGLWFDRDELRRLKDSVDGDLNWRDFKQILRLFRLRLMAEGSPLMLFFQAAEKTSPFQ